MDVAKRKHIHKRVCNLRRQSEPRQSLLALSLSLCFSPFSSHEGSGILPLAPSGAPPASKALEDPAAYRSWLLAPPPKSLDRRKANNFSEWF